MNVAVGVEPLAESILGVTRDKDHLHIGVDFPDFPDQGGPIHVRHHDIGDQQVDRTVGRLDQFERRFAALRLEDLVAFVAQGARPEDPDRILVLDQHDRADPGQILGRQHLRHIAGAGIDRRRIGELMARQVDLEIGAPPGRAIDKDEPAGLLDDAVNRR